MEKKRKISLYLVIVSIVSKLIFYILNDMFGYYFLISGVDNGVEINFDQNKLDTILNFTFVIALTYLILSSIKRKGFKKIVKFLSGCVILIMLLLAAMLNNQNYYSFSSPNKENILVVKEDSFLLSGWSDFYVRKNFIFVERLKASISTDDGFTPFKCNSYEFKWIDENNVELTYSYGSGDIRKKQLINIKEKYDLAIY